MLSGMATPSRVAGSHSCARAVAIAAWLNSSYVDGEVIFTLVTLPSAPIQTVTPTAASIPCAFSSSGYFDCRRSPFGFGWTYTIPATGIREATALCAAAGAGGGGAAGASVGVFCGACARSAVSPARVLPTANAGPLPPSVVDYRLRPTTRSGAFGGVGSGGGVGFATFGGGAGRAAFSGGGSGFFSSSGGGGGGW